MTDKDYRRRLHEFKVATGMNLRYHQTLEWRYGIADKAIRIAVGLLTVGGLVFFMPAAAGFPGWNLAIALVSVAAATVLNIVPVGDREKFHGWMFRLWNDLRADAVAEELKTCDLKDGKDVPDHALERLCALIGKAESLSADEPAPWVGLLRRCLADEFEAEWGHGIRTAEQVEQERAKRLARLTSVSAAPAAAGPV